MDDQQPDIDPDENAERQGLTVLQLVGSVLAAAFGVQSSRNRQRDFSRGRPGQFIIVGIVFTALFVLLVFTVVQLVLGSVT